MKETALKIINNYGVMHQLKHFNSEVFELNEAILTKEIEYGSSDTTVKMDKTNLQHITEEIADVRFMLRQFQEFYEITDEEIKKVMLFKGNRQLKRMEEENE